MGPASASVSRPGSGLRAQSGSDGWGRRSMDGLEIWVHTSEDVQEGDFYRILDDERDSPKLGQVQVVGHRIGGWKPCSDQAGIGLVGGGADHDGSEAEYAGLGQGLEYPAGSGIRSPEAGSDQGGDQRAPVFIPGFFGSVPGDFICQFRAVRAYVFLGPAAFGHGGAEVPVLAASDGTLDETAGRIEFFRHLTELRPLRQFGVHCLDRQGGRLGYGGNV
jgi:hypothetical protein